jgi:hypothetical protein
VSGVGREGPKLIIKVVSFRPKFRRSVRGATLEDLVLTVLVLTVLVLTVLVLTVLVLTVLVPKP